MTPRLLLTLSLLALPIAATAQCNLAENFDGGFYHPWVVTDPTFAFVENDAFKVAFQSSDSNEYHGAVLDPCVYTDLMVSVRMRDLESTVGKAVAFRNNGMFIGYNVNLRSSPWNDVVLGKGSFSPASILDQAYFPHSTEEWVDVQVEAVGAQIRVWVNGNMVIDYTDPNPILSGWTFLGINGGGGAGPAGFNALAEFDDFCVLGLGTAVPNEAVSVSALKARF